MNLIEAKDFFIKAVEYRDYLNEKGKVKLKEAEDIIAEYLKTHDNLFEKGEKDET